MLVTVDDLAKYMDFGSFDPAQAVAVEFILAGLQSELETFLGRPVEIGTFTESYFVRPEDDGWFGSFHDFGYGSISYISPQQGAFGIGLKRTPVVSVNSVYFSSVGSASVTPVLQIANRDYVPRGFGIDMLYGLSTFETVTINYTAGLDGDNIPFFKLLVLRAASREAQNLYDDNRGIQNIDLRQATPALPTGFSEAELNSVKRYRRQRI